jgi:hypothetical protein
MPNLAALIDRLAASLRDAAHAEWSEAELTAHLRRALAEVSQAAPRRLEAVLPTVAGERTVSIAGLAGLLTVTDVLYPHDPAAPAGAPERPAWRLSPEGALTLLVDEPPRGDGSDDVALRYLARHTIDGLDGATESTLSPAAEEVLLAGAAGYAVEQAALALVGAVTVGDAAARYAAWAAERLAGYRQALAELAAADALRAPEDARVVWAGRV